MKPIFVLSDPGAGQGQGEHALFVGRLSQEKGVRALLQAWHDKLAIPLKIAGDGPLREEMAASIEQLVVELLGRRSNQEIFELMKGARFLIFPSEWYEGFPLSDAHGDL